MPKVLMISGSLPPIRCGVGYYTHRLIEAMAAGNIELSLLSSEGVDKNLPKPVATTKDWKIRRLPRLIREIKRISPEIIHIQYPAVGYGRNLGINLLPYVLRLFNPRFKIIITLHEYHGSRWLGRWRDFITATAAHKIVVSNQADKSALPQRLARKTIIIPIGSNLKKVAKNPKIFEKVMRQNKLDPSRSTLLFFGFAYPNKELELLFEAMSEKFLASWQLLLLTSLNPKNRYQKMLLLEIESLNQGIKRIAATGFLPNEQVSAILQEVRYFVLPQSTPITAKSGTAIAAVQHGLILVACGSPQPQMSAPFKHLENCYLVDEMGSESIDRAIEQLESSAQDRHRISNGAKNLKKYFAWPRIIDEHIKLYGEF